MKKAKFSEQQIAFILRQAEEGTTVGPCPSTGRPITTGRPILPVETG